MVRKKMFYCPNIIYFRNFLVKSCNPPGGWGKDIELFFKLCTNAVTRARGKAELWHWRAVDFGKHWKQLIGVSDHRPRAR